MTEKNKKELVESFKELQECLEDVFNHSMIAMQAIAKFKRNSDRGK